MDLSKTMIGQPFYFKTEQRTMIIDPNGVNGVIAQMPDWQIQQIVALSSGKVLVLFSRTLSNEPAKEIQDY